MIFFLYKPSNQCLISQTLKERSVRYEEMEGRRPEETEKERLWETEEKERETGGWGAKSPGETEKEILIKTRKGSPQKTKKEDRKSRKK